jgi:hypothetical protein
VGGHAFVRDRQTGTTECVSIATAGTPADGAVGPPVISTADASIVAFAAIASNLDPRCAGALQGQLYIRDRQAGTTVCVSLDREGNPANFGAGPSSMSADGRFVVFTSPATNLVPGDTDTFSFEDDVFVYDSVLGTTALVSVAADGTPAGAVTTSSSRGGIISADGRIIS